MADFTTVIIQSKELIDAISSLSTFDQVKEWDANASTQIDILGQSIRALDSEAIKVKSEFDQALLEHNNKSFISKVFSKNPKQKFDTTISEIENQKAKLELFIEEIQNKIDFTPNTESEKKTLLTELRLHKKELSTQKREIQAEMREIRVNARQESANVSNNLLGIVGGSKVTAAQRRSIRYQKEADLAPHEDQKAAIERQLIEVDRLVLWVERIK
jgi:hypothetical protein